MDISNNTFKTWDDTNFSSIIFIILEGLHQETVNSPVLRSIYPYDSLNLFDLDADKYIGSIVFADDVKIYFAGTRPTSIKDKLENLVNKLSNWYMTWNLKLNPVKSVSILYICYS